jgi:hypothetical protein
MNNLLFGGYWGRWETFMRPKRRLFACDKMATNASFRLSEREVTHGTG